MIEPEIKDGGARKEKKSDLAAESEAPGSADEVQQFSLNDEIELVGSASTQTNKSAVAVGLNKEIEKFSTSDQIALGDLEIRKQFASKIVWLFIGSNIFVMIALGTGFWSDYSQLASRIITQDHRIIDNKVIMTLLGATTVQLGAVIYTMTQAIFPTQSVKKQ
ncbi:hypothetical protein SAMN05216386_0891 [Nitrosospira briensis]|uniref:Uncharacterized protein n=1 Tax=Nitrosospira briensis TaxID=35799 RepID=A0A1I4YUE3_9PROT|nr:hypothetical protein [Nitrosospira briensis]SFN41655.1 hypothetical protein SAMN05216386_0891 [Nitrosospira briensis]